MSPDANGMRTKRSSDSKTYEYVYLGDKLVQMAITDHSTSPETVQLMEFSYDAAGQPLTMTLDGVIYYYVLNIQGDVTGLVDSSGKLHMGINYNGYGVGFYFAGVSNMMGTLARTNPLGYRSYVQDYGTGLYYLQSRYYDPEMGRFINADSATSTGQGVIGCNMFSYCLNNPANGCDPCGTCFHRWDFWNDCEECGGETIHDKWENVTAWCEDTYATANNAYQQTVENQAKITVAQNDLIGNAATSAWNAYQRSYEMNQEAQLQDAEMKVYSFSTPERAKASSLAIAAELTLIDAIIAKILYKLLHRLLCSVGHWKKRVRRNKKGEEI